MEYKCSLCGLVISEEEFKDEVFVCPKCGARKYQFIENITEEEEDKRVPISKDNPSINRVLEKCINCGVCKRVCSKKTGIMYDSNNSGDFCVNCGACVLNCPTGALTPKYDFREVFDEINDKNKIVIAFTAPSVRVGLGECFGMPFGENVQGKMVKAIRALGFDYVLDTTFGADVTIMEEVTELIERLNTNYSLPMFTSCCSSWVKYVNTFYPDMMEYISTTKSPNAIMGSLIKSYFASKKGLNPKDIVTVGIVPCTSKKYEATREDLVTGDFKDLDYILTTTELALMIRERKLVFKDLETSDFDSLMGTGSSAGLIFGSSGGVMEAAIRTLNFMLTGDNLSHDCIDISCVRGNEFLREGVIKILDKEIRVAVVYGLNNAKIILDEVKSGLKKYDFVEVMTCENGCVGGSGQTLHTLNMLEEARNARLSNLFKIDKESSVRFCHENEKVKQLYKEFLVSPGSEKSQKLLHTKVKVEVR